MTTVKRLRILLCSLGFPYAVEALKANLSTEHDMRTLQKPVPITEQVKDVEVIIPAMTEIDRSVIEAAPRLKLIQQFGVGVENVDIECATQHGVYVANVPAENAVSVAEHALFLMLALAKNYKASTRIFREGKIGQPPSHEIFGKTLAIVGLGASGRELAKRAMALGMRVLAIKKKPNPRIVEELGLEFLGGPGDLDLILRKADYVSIHVPLTPETVGMIGPKQLEKMKRAAYIINVARGPIINEEALYEALKVGRIAGAGLDVFWREPPDPDNPLFRLENVITTPHIAGVSFEAYDRVAKVVAKNIESLARGEQPLNLINREVKGPRKLEEG